MRAVLTRFDQAHHPPLPTEVLLQQDVDLDIIINFFPLGLASGRSGKTYLQFRPNSKSFEPNQYLKQAKPILTEQTKLN